MDVPMSNAEDVNYMDERHLPSELLAHILSLLPVRVRVMASRVCRYWYEVSLNPELHDDEAVTIRKDFLRPLKQLKDCPVKFQHFHFHEVNMEVESSSAVSEFWACFGPNIKSLSFNGCRLSSETLVNVLKGCPHVESLHLNKSIKTGKGGSFLSAKHQEILTRSLSNVKTLSLKDMCLTDVIIMQFESLVPNITTLSLAGCVLDFVHKNVTMEQAIVLPVDLHSATKCSYLRLLNWIYRKASQLKQINLSSTDINSFSLTLLAQMEHLNLTSVFLNCCFKICRVDPYLLLCQRQKNITELSLDFSVVNDKAVITICECLPRLELLSLESCDNVTIVGAETICQLTRLRSLNLTRCVYVKGPVSVYRLSHLSHLYMNFMRHAVTDFVIQEMCRKLPRLRTLGIRGTSVTDVGITGRSKAYFSSNSTGNHFLGQNSLSTEEKHLYKDSQFQQSTSRESEDGDDDCMEAVALTILKGLEALYLSKCSNVTDISCIYAIKFINLKILDLSKCPQITDEGVMQLAKNNPSIQHLDLCCCNITNLGAITALKGFIYLIFLGLEGCRQLTDCTLEAVTLYGHELRHLNVTDCSGMSLQGVEKMEQLTPWIVCVEKRGIELKSWDIDVSSSED